MLTSLKKDVMMYVGTYTNGESKGLYSFRVTTNTGKGVLTYPPISLINPSYMTIDSTKGILYSVCKIINNEKETGGIAVISIDKGSGELLLRKLYTTNCQSSCYVCIDKKSRFLYTANYHDGSISMLALDQKGDIGELLSVLVHKGRGPNKERQSMPHVHYVNFTKNDKYLCAVDLGTDQIIFYHFCSETGALTIDEEKTLRVKAGAGPRHVTFSHDGQFLYVVNELDSTITVFSFDIISEKYEKLQTISTLPSDFLDENACAAIFLSNDERYLYSSNRGHDSIVTYKREADGTLSVVDWTSTKGKNPRDFQIDPSGTLLFVANQDTNNIETFQICKETGRLKDLNEPIYVPSPICIKFFCLEE